MPPRRHRRCQAEDQISLHEFGQRPVPVLVFGDLEPVTAGRPEHGRSKIMM